jgi:hypothetical protein
MDSDSSPYKQERLCRGDRVQSITRMFQPIISVSYKPHPLVGGAVDLAAAFKLGLTYS